MAFNLVGALILLALSTGLNLLLRPRIKRARAPDLEFPKAEEGVPIPLGYGTFVVAPNIVWWGDSKLTPSPVGSTYYAANMVATLCLGPVNELVDINVGGKSLRFEPVTNAQGGPAGAAQVIVPSLPSVQTAPNTPTSFSIQAAQMFGGREREGGIRGTMRFYSGGLNQPADAITTAYMTAAPASLTGGTGRPGVCYAVFGFEGSNPFYWGTVPTPKDITFILKFSPTALGVGMLGRDANPAEIIYDLLTNNLRGLGLATNLIDIPNFTAVATTLKNEGLGLSPVFTSQDEVEDMIDEILKHIMGVLRISPITGKYELKLARADYTTLPRITTSLRGASFGNARNVQLSRPNYRETTNDIQITYRRFYTSPIGTTVGQVLTGPGGLDYIIADTIVYFDVGATNLTLVTLKDDGATIPTTVYTLEATIGLVALFNGGAGSPAEGSVITIDYTAGPVFNGYKEATARWQDLASIQQSGELRPFTADYPFFTSDLTAGNHVARLGQQMSRSLWHAKWEMDRTGYGLAPGDVVAVNHTPMNEDGSDTEILLDLPFRITEVDYGLLEEGTITVHAIEDVFAQDVFPILPQPDGGTGGPTLTPPAIAISYAPTSAIRVCLFPSDQNFNIRLWRAPSDLGQGVTTGAALGVVLPGTSPYYDDTLPVAGRAGHTAGRPFADRWRSPSLYGAAPQYAAGSWTTRDRPASRMLAPAGDSIALGATHWYAAQLVPTTRQIGYGDGALTPWQSMTATAGVPGSCTCAIPTVIYTTAEDGFTASVTLTVTDAQNRKTKVEFQTQAGLGPLSEWTEDTTAPYTASVARVAGASSTISYRVTYLNCAGASVSDLTGTIVFPLSSGGGGNIMELGNFVYEGANPLVE